MIFQTFNPVPGEYLPNRYLNLTPIYTGEKRVFNKFMRYVIGVDEVGRGPLAGPVVLAAVCIPVGLKIGNKKLGKLKDSKKISQARRELWSEYIKNHPQIRFTLARLYPRAIERLNISKAANLASYRVCLRLMEDLKLNPLRCKIYLDGGLYPRNNRVSLISKTVVRGDEKINAIKIASILAKVQRDRFMVKLAKKYPDYGFEKHKGYGTKLHRKMLKKLGPTEMHRLTFLGKYHIVSR